MPLNIVSRLEDGVAIVELSGTFTLGPWLASFRSAMYEVLTSQKAKGIVLSVSGVAITDSSGLGELTALYTSAAKRQCPIRLVGVSTLLREMLEVTHLDALLPIAPDIHTAKSEVRGAPLTRAARPGI